MESTVKGPTDRRHTWQRGVAWALATAGFLALGAGCASWPVVGPAVLAARADEHVRDGAWYEAIASYDELLARFPDHPSAPRVLENRNSLAAMLTARAQLARQRDEVHRLHDELMADRTRLQGETAALRSELFRLHSEQSRLREELLRRERDLARAREAMAVRESDLARAREAMAAHQAEAQRLREDIERLKQIDAQLERLKQIDLQLERKR